MKYHLTRMAFVLALLMLAGCGDETPSSSGTPQGQNNDTNQQGNGDDPKPKKPKVEAKVELKATTVAELKTAIEKHKGQVVLIDAWGIT